MPFHERHRVFNLQLRSTARATTLTCASHCVTTAFKAAAHDVKASKARSIMTCKIDGKIDDATRDLWFAQMVPRQIEGLQRLVWRQHPENQ
jgi:hypothetical protein